MVFQEADAGDYKIYAGAVERPKQFGYVAAVIVMRVRGLAVPKETYRNEAVAGGFAWASSADALRAAMKAGRDTISGRLPALA